MSERIEDSLQEVFRKVFKQNNLVISKATTANDIDGWDSFMHVELIASVESAFGVAFSFNEVIKFNSVGDLLLLLEQKIKQ